MAGPLSDFGRSILEDIIAAGAAGYVAGPADLVVCSRLERDGYLRAVPRSDRKRVYVATARAVPLLRESTKA